MAEKMKSMAQLLIELNINETTTFMLAKRDSAVSTVQRLKFKGYKFKCKTDISKGCCIITKIMNPK